MENLCRQIIFTARKRSFFGKVIFLHLSVILFTGEYLVRYTPLDRYPHSLPIRWSLRRQYASYWNAFLVPPANAVCPQRRGGGLTQCMLGHPPARERPLETPRDPPSGKPPRRPPQPGRPPSQGDPPARETPLCQGDPPGDPHQGDPLPGRPPCQGAPCQGDPPPLCQGDPPRRYSPARETPLPLQRRHPLQGTPLPLPGRPPKEFPCHRDTPLPGTPLPLPGTPLPLPRRPPARETPLQAHTQGGN